MFLHTIIDINEILYSPENSEYKECPDTNKSEYKEHGKIFVKGTSSPKGFIIQGLFSTNPKDFLNPEFKAGNILKE